MPEVILSGGWTRVAFGDVVQLSGERSSNPARDRFERFVGLEHIDPGDLKLRRWGHVSDGTTFTSVFRPGRVLFGKRRAYQRKVAVADFSGVCSGDIYVLEPKNGRLVPELLPFICRTDGFFEHAVGTSAGSLSPRTKWDSLASYEFGLPPLDDQRQIASALNSGLAASEAVRVLLGRALTVHRANLSELQSSAYSKQARLGELLDRIVPGRSVAGVDIAPTEVEFGVLRVSAVDPVGFNPRESKRLLDPTQFAPEYGIFAGDLLITRANTAELVGESCLVDRDYPNLMLCDKTLRLVPRDGVDSYLTWEALQSDGVRRQLRSIATGTGRAMKNISQPKIRGIVVAYPSSRPIADEAKARLLASREATRGLQARLDAYGELTHSLSARLLQRADT